MTTSHAKPLATTADVAAYLSKTPTWVNDNAARLGIPRFKVGKHYRYRMTEIEEWVDARSVAVYGR
jgi:hypothetical protein